MAIQENQEYVIPASEFARICGTTRDTLRYYEKSRLLTPWKDPENGYHYYCYAQIGTFYFISMLRSADLSTRDIYDFLMQNDNAGLLPYIHAQIDALKAQRLELDRKIRQFSVVLALDALIRNAGYGKPALGSFPEQIRFRMAPVTSGNATSLSDIARDIQDHIHLFPDMAGSFPAGTAMDAQAFLEGDYRYIKVVSLYDAEDAFPWHPAMQEAAPGSIESWESVTTFALPTQTVAAVVCRDSDGDIHKIYRRLASFIQKNDLTMLTDVFSVSILNMMGPDHVRRYLKYIFVCVRE